MTPAAGWAWAWSAAGASGAASGAASNTARPVRTRLISLVRFTVEEGLRGTTAVTFKWKGEPERFARAQGVIIRQRMSPYDHGAPAVGGCTAPTSAPDASRRTDSSTVA